MNINSISSAGFSGQTPMSRPTNNTLTDSQKATAADIISKYSADSMTEESAAAMRNELTEAGIKPGEDLKGILESAGFEVQGPEGAKQGGKAQGGGKPPPPPPSESAESSETSSLIQSFLEKYDAGEATEDDVADLIELLRQNGLSTKGVVLDEEA